MSKLKNNYMKKWLHEIIIWSNNKHKIVIIHDCKYDTEEIYFFCFLYVEQDNEKIMKKKNNGLWIEWL